MSHTSFISLHQRRVLLVTVLFSDRMLSKNTARVDNCYKKSSFSWSPPTLGRTAVQRVWRGEGGEADKLQKVLAFVSFARHFRSISGDVPFITWLIKDARGQVVPLLSLSTAAPLQTSPVLFGGGDEAGGQVERRRSAWSSKTQCGTLCFGWRPGACWELIPGTIIIPSCLLKVNYEGTQTSWLSASWWSLPACRKTAPQPRKDISENRLKALRAFNQLISLADSPVCGVSAVQLEAL